MPVAIGVDIGGTHISCAALNSETFEPLSNTFFSGKVNSKASKKDIFLDWSIIINKTLSSVQNEEVIGIGIAMPGPFDYGKGIALFQVNDKYETLYNVSVSRELPRYLNRQDLPVRFINDAASFGIGGALLNKIKAGTKVLAITLGTGFGAAFLEDLVPVTSGVTVPEGGFLWDKEYKNGIADNFFSTRWFVTRYSLLSGKPPLKGVKEIVLVNDSYTQEVFKEFSQNLSEFLGPHLKRFQPDILVIGGNIARAHERFLPDAVEAWKKNNCFVPVTIIPNTEEAGIVGSSYLFNNDFWTRIQKQMPEA